jgi:hypothetical protein
MRGVMGDELTESNRVVGERVTVVR